MPAPRSRTRLILKYTYTVSQCDLILPISSRSQDRVSDAVIFPVSCSHIFWDRINLCCLENLLKLYQLQFGYNIFIMQYENESTYYIKPNLITRRFI